MPKNFGDIYKCMGQVIAERRKRLRMSQQQLSDASGLGRVFISNVEQGSRMASYGAICRIAHGLGLKPSSLARLCERKMEETHGQDFFEETKTADYKAS